MAEKNIEKNIEKETTPTDVNQINFDYEGRHYCLEYTRDTIKQMEGAGFRMNDIGDMPATRIEQLWQGAFLAHHRKTSLNIIKDMFYEMTDREELMKVLATMYNNTLSYLMPDNEENPGNVKWTASR